MFKCDSHMLKDIHSMFTKYEIIHHEANFSFLSQLPLLLISPGEKNCAIYIKVVVTVLIPKYWQNVKKRMKKV